LLDGDDRFETAECVRKSDTADLFKRGVAADGEDRFEFAFRQVAEIVGIREQQHVKVASRLLRRELGEGNGVLLGGHSFSLIDLGVRSAHIVRVIVFRFEGGAPLRGWYSYSGGLRESVSADGTSVLIPKRERRMRSAAVSSVPTGHASLS
jgi:hypothetical protein